MENGLKILITLAIVTLISVILKKLNILGVTTVNTILAMSLGYHICYSIHSMMLYKNRNIRRNKRRGNNRPPR